MSICCESFSQSHLQKYTKFPKRQNVSAFFLLLAVFGSVSMNQGSYIFRQVVGFLPRDYFEWLVKKYDGNKYVKSFTCWNHLLVLIFGQLSNREGLRDLITTISPFRFAFHHLGFGKSVSRSNLGKANEIRDVRIFRVTCITAWINRKS